MQIEMGKGNQMGNNAFSYMQNQLSVLIIKVYVFETFKAIDKDVYRALFGSEGKSVNDTMAEISPAQIEEIDVNPRYEVQYIDMKKSEYNEMIKTNEDNDLSGKEFNDIYNEKKDLSDDLLNMMDDSRTDTDLDETMLKK